MKLKKLVKQAVSPVVSMPAKAIQKASGLDLSAQLGIGAGIGGAAALLRGPAYGRGLAPGVEGPQGPPASSGRGVFSMLGGMNALSPLLGAGASIFGAREQAQSVEAANEANVNLAREQMSFSAGQAQRQMDFQEQMSGTAYQRQVADLKSAGLNPMLAVGGGGASSPGGASGSASLPSVSAIPSVVANSLSSAMEMLRTTAAIRQADASASLAETEAGLRREKGPAARVSGKMWSIIESGLNKVQGFWNNSGKSVSEGGYPARGIRGEWDLITDKTNEWMREE